MRGWNDEMTEEEPNVLLVEDDPNHELLVEIALRRASLGVRVRSVQNGALAIQYLTGEPPFDNREKYPLPAVIILDLNLPIVTGFEFLEWLQGRKDFWEIPVLVFTASDDPKDAERAYGLGIKAYRQKTEDFDTVVDPVRDFLEKWVGPGPR